MSRSLTLKSDAIQAGAKTQKIGFVMAAADLGLEKYFRHKKELKISEIMIFFLTTTFTNKFMLQWDSYFRGWL